MSSGTVHVALAGVIWTAQWASRTRRTRVAWMVAVAVLGLSAASTAAATSDTTIVPGDRAGSYLYLDELDAGRSYPAALAAFGAPTSRGAFRQSNLCVVRWTRLGIEISFATAPPACTAANLRRASWYGMSFHDPRWVTDRGVRVGSTAAALRRAYPKAWYRDRPPDPPQYWLQTTRNEFGSLVPVIWAEVRAGRVVSLHVPANYVW